MIPTHDFDTYRSCGLKIDLNFAIDLTISNGNYQKGEKSLHPKAYSEVMEKFGSIIEEITPRAHIVQTFGFGAK
jgi:hypothetical protein